MFILLYSSFWQVNGAESNANISLSLTLGRRVGLSPEPLKGGPLSPVAGEWPPRRGKLFAASCHKMKHFLVLSRISASTAAPHGLVCFLSRFLQTSHSLLTSHAPFPFIPCTTLVHAHAPCQTLMRGTTFVSVASPAPRPALPHPFIPPSSPCT